MIHSRQDKSSGFTLIEVLIALVIVGISLPALLIRMQSVMDDTIYIDSKTQAHWLAENKMQEMIITHKLQGNVVKTKKREDQEEFAGREWFWKVVMEQTAVPKIYRMEVTVGLEEDKPLVNLSGFLSE